MKRIDKHDWKEAASSCDLGVKCVSKSSQNRVSSKNAHPPFVHVLCVGETKAACHPAPPWSDATLEQAVFPRRGLPPTSKRWAHRRIGSTAWPQEGAPSQVHSADPCQAGAVDWFEVGKLPG